eukprot:TRINITY_DN350_c0_g10_i1.p1 TRINITY_DN350_c0_g10~~TRINITY_DN350_c0_g10_i1.p1  ORF type:complete len:934 (+),score=236.90 TRINITY_DN350_c0_g10_i1:72-2873(+)
MCCCFKWNSKTWMVIITALSLFSAYQTERVASRLFSNDFKHVSDTTNQYRNIIIIIYFLSFAALAYLWYYKSQKNSRFGYTLLPQATHELKNAEANHIYVPAVKSSSCFTGFLFWLAVALVVIFNVLGIACWGLRALTLPTTSGSLELDCLTAKVSVKRSALGVPYIEAENELDAFRAQGAVHVQDRLFQMEYQRLLATGRISEVLGASLVEVDKYTRTLGFRRNGIRNWENLDPAAKARITAYLEGANGYLESVSFLSLEHLLLGMFSVEPFTEVDLMAWAGVLQFNMCYNYLPELTIYGSRLGNTTLPMASEVLLAENPIDTPTAISEEEAAGKEWCEEHADIDIMAEANVLEAFLKENLDIHHPVADLTYSSGYISPDILRALDLPFGRGPSGSNGWAISGEFTKSGKPIMANDPHVNLQAPNFMYLNSIKAPGLDLNGASVVLSPGILAGKSGNDVSWGVTLSHTDVQDIFVLKPGQSDNTYRHNGEDKEFKVITERIIIKDADPIDFDVRISVHGPVISGLSVLSTFFPHDNTLPLALAYTADHVEVDRSVEGLIFGGMGATTTDELMDNLNTVESPTMNIIMADAEGNIGFKTTGAHPIRPKKTSGAIPLPGTGEYDWQGLKLGARSPRSKNPSSKQEIVANNRLLPLTCAPMAHTSLYPFERAERIENELFRLRDEGKITMADMLTLMDDGRSNIMDYTIDALEHMELKTDKAKVWRSRLVNWDLETEPEMIEPTFFYNFMNELFEVMFHDVLVTPNTCPARTAIFFVRQSLNMEAEHKDADFCLAQGKTCLELCAEAFEKAAEIVPIPQETVPVGQAHPALIDHILFHTSEMAAPFFDRYVEVKGDLSAIFMNFPDFDTGYGEVGPVLKLISDLSDLDKMEYIIPMGQSGNVLSKHYDDMLQLWVDNETVDATPSGEMDELILTP